MTQERVRLLNLKSCLLVAACGLVIVVAAAIYIGFFVIPTYHSRFSAAEEDIGQIVANLDRIELREDKSLTRDDPKFHQIYEIICEALKRPPDKADYHHSYAEPILHSTRDYDNDGEGDWLQVVLCTDGICFYGPLLGDEPICYPLYPIEAFQLKAAVLDGAY